MDARSPHAFFLTVALILAGNFLYQLLIPFTWNAVTRATGLSEISPLGAGILFYGFPVLVSLIAATSLSVFAPGAALWRNAVVLAICLAAPIFGYAGVVALEDFACSQHWLGDCID